jgi:tetratricopeptide (TPR) repeat protein
MSPRTFLRRTALCGAMLVASTTVLANGGGGTGGGTGGITALPSQSAPSYDPAEEYRKGIAALESENFKAANRAFTRVLRVAPRDANTHFLAGLARAGLGKLKDARRHYEKAIKYDDDLILAHRELGVVWARLDEPDKARAVLQTLEKRATDCADTCRQAADLEVAIPAIKAALGTAPTSQLQPQPDLLFRSADSGDLSYLAAVALINEQRYDAATAALHQAARAFGPHPDILTYLGFVQRKQGRFDRAENYYRRALAIAPDHVGATEYYGELMVEHGDLAGAQRMLAKLERVCRFGCAEADELRRWIDAATNAGP